MMRCDYDGAFYRVFCVTLLGIAVAFSVILTNVFIDIDGLLSSKQDVSEKVYHEESTVASPSIPEVDNLLEQQQQTLNGEDNILGQKQQILDGETTYFVPEDQIYSDEESNGYRTKRSLETPMFQLHLKNPKTKKILTSHLAQLLERLDAEQSERQQFKGTPVEDTTSYSRERQELKGTPVGDTTSYSREIPDGGRISEQTVITEGNTNVLPERQKEGNLLHLAMHNILLKGITGHMDLMDVYNKVHRLMSVMEGQNRLDPENLEAEFFEEMGRCDRLHKEVEEAKENNKIDVNKEELKTRHEGDIMKIRTMNSKEPDMLIKTVIDIKSLQDSGKDSKDTNSENIQGIVKLIYNGHNIPIKGLNNQETKNTVEPLKNDTTNSPTSAVQPNANVGSMSDIEKSLVSEAHLKKAIADYFSNNVKVSNGISGLIKSRKKINKRLKRNIKIHHHKKGTSHKSTHVTKKKNKGDEDELYVEIETNFDDKGITGQKKRKLILNLVDKIEKAINDSIHVPNSPDDPGKKHQTPLKKRHQTPLNYKRIKKILVPTSQVTRRESNPISKSVPSENVFHDYSDRKRYIGPHFFSPGKAINSGELGQVDLDYTTISKNGIPQRLQQPLATGVMNEPYDAPTYFDLGNLKFYIQDIDGTGFSIGFNQYVGEAPDPEAIGFLTDLKQLISTYHKKYDTDIEQIETRLENPNAIKNSEEHFSAKRDINKLKVEHNVVRRSTSDLEDNHFNEYILTLNKDSLPYNTYQEIYENKDKQRHQRPNMPDHPKKIPLDLDENILRRLNPSEILGLANLLDRKKRSLNYKKSEKNRGNKHVTLVNTGRKKIFIHKPKKIFIKTKRNKRQTYDKIRIIASDHLPNVEARSDENLYVVSDEILSTREPSSMGDVGFEDQPELKSEEGYFDLIHPPPLLPFDNRRIMQNYIPNLSPVFKTHSRHNKLMSKYPHLFMEEISRSKEEPQEEIPTINLADTAISGIINNNMNKESRDMRERTPETLSESLQVVTEPIHDVKTLYDAIAPKANYKLTVKIQPKNMTEAQSGFKEIHTSINKSFTRDGIKYISLVNVSQISKVEKESNLTTTMSPIIQDLQRQQEKISNLLRAHRKKINHQLDQMKKDSEKEREKIETNTEKEGVKDTIDVIIPSNPPQLVHLKKDEARKLISATLRELHHDSTANHLLNNVKTASTTTPPHSNETPKTTKDYSCCPTTEKSTIDPDNVKITKTMQINENLTNKILSKIDQNTELLQTFLKKIVDRIDPMLRAESRSMKYDHSYPKEWRPHEPYIRRSMPKLAINNETYEPKPLPYAYQTSFPPPPQNIKPVSPTPSVVFQDLQTYTQNNIPSQKSMKLNETPIKFSEKGINSIPAAGIQTNNNASYFIDREIRPNLSADVA